MVRTYWMARSPGKAAGLFLCPLSHHVCVIRVDIHCAALCHGRRCYQTFMRRKRWRAAAMVGCLVERVVISSAYSVMRATARTSPRC